MKKKFNAKVFSLACMAALSLALLTGCGTTDTEETAAAGFSGESQTAGTLLLSVNPEIEVTYDDQGNVTALTAMNQEGEAILASYTDFGKRAGGRHQPGRLLRHHHRRPREEHRAEGGAGLPVSQR